MTTTGATSQDEIITGPKDGDSLADDLDNRREITGDMLLGGHPNDELGEEALEGGPEVKSGEETKPGEEEAKSGEEAPKKEEPPIGPRFKSQEDAEKAHAEAERRMHEATTKEAEERKAREKAERELEELRQAQAKLPEKKPEEKPVVKAPTEEERTAKISEAAKTANLAAMPKLRSLDPDDPDYEEKYAAIMTDINVAIGKALLEVSIAPSSLTREEVEKIYEERAKTEREKVEAAEAGRIEIRAKEMGVKAGLSLDDPESADSIIWDRFKTQIPQEVYDKNSLEAQVEWVTNKVRSITGKVALTVAEKEEAARKIQEDNQPLGRGGVRPKPAVNPKDETPGSLAEDFNEAAKRRVLG